MTVFSSQDPHGLGRKQVTTVLWPPREHRAVLTALLLDLHALQIPFVRANNQPITSTTNRYMTLTVTHLLRG